jgi:hypothetical protein
MLAVPDKACFNTSTPQHKECNMPRKPQPSPQQVAAVVALATGILAGPYGKAVMDSQSTAALDGVADAALDMYDAVLRRIEARQA